MSLDHAGDLQSSGRNNNCLSKLVLFGEKVRNIREYGLTEGASSRLLIYAAQLIHNGISAAEACRVAICLPLSDDEQLQETLSELVEDIFDAA